MSLVSWVLVLFDVVKLFVNAGDNAFEKQSFTIWFEWLYVRKLAKCNYDIFIRLNFISRLC